MTIINPYATISRRFIALIADTLILAIVIIPFLFISMGKSPESFNESGDEGRPSLMDKYQFFAYFEPIALDNHRDIYIKNFVNRFRMEALVGFLLIPMLYFVFFEGLWGGTIGKLFTGIRVRRKDGGKINFVNAFLRFIGKIFSTMIFMLGYILALFDKKRQTLHDKIANTVVLNKGASDN